MGRIWFTMFAFNFPLQIDREDTGKSKGNLAATMARVRSDFIPLESIESDARNNIIANIDQTQLLSPFLVLIAFIMSIY